MTNYIYALRCPIANTVRYIGKSSNPQKRFRSHLSAAKRFAYRHHTSAWIRKLLAEGLKPELVVLEEVSDCGSWQEAERSWISKAASLGWELTNSTAGGEGLDYICPIATAAYRAKLSATHKIIWNTPERREEARQRSLTSWADPEITARRKASQEAARATPETKARFVAAALEINSRPEVQVKRKRSLEKHWAVPENKAKRLEAYAAPEVKAKQSAAKIALWASDGGRAKMLATHTPARRAHQAKLLADPERKAKIDAARNSEEYKAKRAATIRAKWIAKNSHLTPEELAAAILKNDKARAKKAAILAATTSTPYTESS